MGSTPSIALFFRLNFSDTLNKGFIYEGKSPTAWFVSPTLH
jgi:hypothetical protein